MKNKKIFISAFLVMLIALITFTSTSVYAEEDWTYEERMNTKTKVDFGTYTSIDQFYATPNMDAVRVIKQYYKYLLWNTGPWYEPDNDIYMAFGEYSDPDVLVLQPHYGYNQNVYSRMTRPKQIESYDGKAEYIIGMNQYDQILIILDGSTFKGNLGDIVNDFFLNVVDEQYRVKHEFYCPYESCAKEGGCMTISRYRSGSDVYMATCCYEVGFNLTKESTQTPVDNNLEDPAIYGGNDEVQIDDTPTQPESSDTFDGWQIVGIVASSIASLVGIYLIYLLGKKIYEIMKGN